MPKIRHLAIMCMDPQKLADFLQHECHVVGGRLVNRTSGRRIRAVMPQLSLAARDQAMTSSRIVQTIPP